MHQTLYQEAVQLLQALIATPSFSKEEASTATLIEQFLLDKGIPAKRLKNNVWAVNANFDVQKPVLLLNSHHDTVKPNAQYTRNPFEPNIEADQLFGLGSNDAGGCLVSLIATFVHFYAVTDLPFNIVLAATAEEEISGKEGIEALLQDVDFIAATHDSKEQLFSGWTGIVGEPTLLDLAIAERGLLVVDAVAHGKAGHAARNEGDNALYKAIADIQTLQHFVFDKKSAWLGATTIQATVIETPNKQHNVVPASCNYVLDIRVNECYIFDEVLQQIRALVSSTLTPRSLRMRSTSIAETHPLVQAGIQLGKQCYGSPTTSDKALMPFPALKVGPGFSGRSHSADEFIFLHEIEAGITFYIALLNVLTQHSTLSFE
ncbi:MAG: M20/M25/M40 family metallo-hydrolase [Ferruginibacter sp.]